VIRDQSKREWLLLIGTVAATLLVALGLLRLLAPGLLGVPRDLQVVSVDEKTPPFFDNVFRAEDRRAQEIILRDPLVRVRARPLLADMGSFGPTDILGFRNRGVPNVVDILAIGDSQTFGNNATLEQSWPSVAARLMKGKQARLYNASVGGWGAVQYLDIFQKMSALRPRAVIVAFYSGNDALESFLVAYAIDAWRHLIPDPAIGPDDMPEATFPAPAEEWWEASFADGYRTLFTPRLRLVSNMEHPAVGAGYAIMKDVGRRIATAAAAASIQVLFTVIPTKELVYARKVEAAGLEPPRDYLDLIREEQENIDDLRTVLERLEGSVYVDLVTPLQTAAMGKGQLYPRDTNGHPLAAGYAVMGHAVAERLQEMLPDQRRGLVAQMRSQNAYSWMLVAKDGLWSFPSADMIEANGWAPSDSVPSVSERDLAGLPRRGVIDRVDKARFGPQAFE
jgi:lysophospholipase L1-like esterase